MKRVAQYKARPLVLDDLGRERNPYLSSSNEPRSGLYEDPRIKVRCRAKRKKGGLAFVREGRFIKEAELLRVNSLRQAYEIRDARRHFAQRRAVRHEKSAAAVPMRALQVGSNRGYRLPASLNFAVEKAPPWEWWDSLFLPAGKTSRARPFHISLVAVNTRQRVHRFVEHPPKLKGQCVHVIPASHPLMLTKRERKRLRRKQRKEHQSERVDLIRLGLMKAPEPRMKLSNLMRILGAQAVADPSQMESKVRHQIAARRAQHLSMNEGRRLSKEARRAKILRKGADEVAIELHAVLFGVYGCAPLGIVEGTDEAMLEGSAYDANVAAQRRFKLDVNAQENLLTGCCFVCENFVAGEQASFVNLVFIEGSRRATRRFSKLMTRRIDWNSGVVRHPTPDKHMDRSAGGIAPLAASSTRPVNSCSVLWHGIGAKSCFDRFEFHEARPW